MHYYSSEIFLVERKCTSGILEFCILPMASRQNFVELQLIHQICYISLHPTIAQHGSIVTPYYITSSACVSQMIDEFTDVNEGEKELMKLWNLFMDKKR